jgi:hypothetical protein
MGIDGGIRVGASLRQHCVCLPERFGGPVSPLLGGTPRTISAVYLTPGLALIALSAFARLLTLARRTLHRFGVLLGMARTVGRLVRAGVAIFAGHGSPAPRGRSRLRPGDGRRRRLIGHKRRSGADAETDVTKLALQTPLAGEPTSIVIQRGGIKRLGNPLQGRRAELVPCCAEQASGVAEQLVERATDLLAAVTQSARVPLAGEHV